MLGRVIGIALLAGLAAFSRSFQAKAESFSYDPELCKQGAHEKIYISLGRYVFPMAYAKQQAVVYDPLLPHNADLALNVPDPTEQRGCFGNPLQSTSHALFTPGILAKGGQLASVGSALWFITLYRLDSGNASREADKIWRGETLELSLAESTCKQAKLREELPNGMSTCLVRPNDVSTPREEWSATYRARPEVYTTPMNRPFVVNCLSGSGSRWPCDVAYEIMPDLGVSYKLFPRSNGNSAPIDHIIEIDRSIRATLADSIVKDYPWPAQVMDSR
jgi:hypothetical protein